MRVIPQLLINGNYAYKGINFKKHKYLGDPINIIRIFNDKYVDEMSLFDYSQNKTINYELLKKISNEAFFPISYGGGIESLKMIEKVISCGYERVIINSHQYKETSFLENSIKEFGTSTIIAAIDIKKNFFGRYKIYTNGGRDLVKFDLANYLIRLNNIGVSEIIINSITNDGTKSGYDYKLIDIVNEYLTNTNFIIAGGSRGKKDFDICRNDKIVSACIAGSCFVFQGKYDSVLINYNI